MNTKILGRYRGGKEKLADKIVALFPKGATIYVEPFGGGMSVLLHTAGMFRQRVYNDINDDLVVMWRMIRDRPEELAAKIWATPYARAEMQACFPPSAATDDLERARRMIVMGNMHMSPTRGDASSFAVNKSGSLEHKWLRMPETIIYVANLIRDVCIEYTSAESLFSRYDSSETVWYFDPPYTIKQRVEKVAYHTDLTDLDHFKLAKQIETLQGSVFISGYDNDLYAACYAQYQRVEWEVHNMSNITPERRGNNTKREVLWYRYAPSMLSQQCMSL